MLNVQSTATTGHLSKVTISLTLPNLSLLVLALDSRETLVCEMITESSM